MSSPGGTNRDGQIPYTPTQANDKGYELVNIAHTWWKANKFGITSTDRTNVSVAISNILATWPQ